MSSNTEKILIVSTSESRGGAAIAAKRLLDALNANGCNARMLVMKGNIPDRMRFLWERYVIWVCNRFHKEYLFHISIANTGRDITHTKEFKEADIIHLHWTQQGMLSLKNIDRILNSGKPVVWTMHDMWLSTGICHHSDGCSKYSSHCGNCKYLQSGCDKDLSYRVFEKKNKLFRDSDFTVVTCSDWLHGKAGKSALLSGKTILSIPNPIDTSVFCPSDKAEARKELGLPMDKNLILFASQKVTDKRKGIDYLCEAAGILESRNREFEFVVMGQNSDMVSDLLPHKVWSMGYVDSESKARLIYNACDMFVTPSLMENLPNTIMEAMSCGTPCIGFATGGIPEMIDHLQNGYVAAYKDSQDLADGMEWVISHQEQAARNARQKAVGTWDQAIVAERFKKLYKDISR